MRPEIADLIAIATEEWHDWGDQSWNLVTGTRVRDRQLTDDNAERARRVRDVYCPAGESASTVAAIQGDVFPWSAVFMSFVFRSAGATAAQFPFADAHHHWIRAAVAARAAQDADALHWAFRLDEAEAVPRPGDLVAYARGEPPPSFAAAQRFFDRTRGYPSHSDLVVAVRPDEIDVIGGNVGDTVTKKTVPVDAEGRITDRIHPWFAVLRRHLL